MMKKTGMNTAGMDVKGFTDNFTSISGRIHIKISKNMDNTDLVNGSNLKSSRSIFSGLHSTQIAGT